MRRNKPRDPEKYIRVRLQMLNNEKHKNDDVNTHLILDKSIFELSVVLDLITRNKQTTP